MPRSRFSASQREPNLRELRAELDQAFQALLLAKVETVSSRMDERDRRYEDRFTAMDEKTSLALTASEKAVTKAETSTEKRFDAVNEFRGTLSDQATNLLPRAEAAAKFTALEEKVAGLKDELTRVAAIGSGSKSTVDAIRTNMLAVVAVGGLILTVITLAFRLIGK